MTDLTQQFEAHRPHLRAVAYRMLGSRSEADDAVQDAWLRLAHSDAEQVRNLRGWLTTVVARVCLDMLRSRTARREEPMHTDVRETLPGDNDAERDLQMADSVGVAMLVVLETLAPAERIAFVLHDMFDVSFEDIAPIVDRTPAAARQLASRARRRVRGASALADADPVRQREVVGAFLAAARDGNLTALVAVLDPDIVLHADAAIVEASLTGRAGDAPILAPEVRGTDAVAAIFKGRLRAARPALVNGAAGLVIAPGGQARAVFEFGIKDDRIVQIRLSADPGVIGTLDLQMANT
jgi:RNA polymerase sigma-70 factor (ECF subfamily)